MMTAVVVVDAQVVTVRGHHVRECLRRARMRPIYVHGQDAQGWRLDRARLADCVAALERGGYLVRIEGQIPERPAVQDVSGSARPAPVAVDEGGLW